jgi:Domain of unknown function (DUF4412)
MFQFKTFATVYILNCLFMIACSANGANGGCKDSLGYKSLSTSGLDWYFEYATSAPETKQGKVSGSRKIYLSADGNARMEQVFLINGKAYNSIVSIVRFDRPNYSIVLDEERKTYSLIEIDKIPGLEKTANMKWEVKKLGNENALGYACYHAQMSLTVSLTKSIHPITVSDVWTSREVPGYSTFSAIQQKMLTRGEQATDQMKNAGCEGMMVKMESKSSSGLSATNLVKAEHRNLPASLFEIPMGYQEEK